MTWQFNGLFKSISVIPGQWKHDNEKDYAMRCCLAIGLERDQHLTSLAIGASLHAMQLEPMIPSQEPLPFSSMQFTVLYLSGYKTRILSQFDEILL